MIVRKKIISIIIVCLCAALNACAIFPDKDSHQRTCSELKHRLMFSNGAGAMDQNQAFEDRVQMDKLNQSYHDEDCV